MCSARARRCRAQYDVLFIPQLVKDFFVAFCASVCCCCCCCCNASYFRIFLAPKNRHIGGAFTSFDTLGAKNTVNTDVFCASEARCLFASGSKNHGIYNVVWPAPSKNIGIYAIFYMLQEDARRTFPCQRHKSTAMFWLLASAKKEQKSAKKWQTWTSKKRLVVLSPFFPILDPEKLENTTRVKDFLGGSAGGARPRVAKASCRLHAHTRAQRGIAGFKGLTPYALPTVLAGPCIKYGSGTAAGPESK